MKVKYLNTIIQKVNGGHTPTRLEMPEQCYFKTILRGRTACSISIDPRKLSCWWCCQASGRQAYRIFFPPPALAFPYYSSDAHRCAFANSLPKRIFVYFVFSREEREREHCQPPPALCSFILCADAVFHAPPSFSD